MATDLLSGEPIYFSSQFVYCKPYGWSTPEDVTIAEALYSSAAFPGAFPPKKLKMKKLKFQDGDMPGDLPKAARLADGGVYNNLGNDWFKVLHEELPLSLWRFGELVVAAPTVDPRNVIVVNAGAPSTRVDRILPFPLSLTRIMSVLYENTVRPRLDLIQNAGLPLIDIREAPPKLADRLKKLGGDLGARAATVAETLKERTEEFWADFSHETAGTETKLSKVGVRTSARLMLHGYLSSLVLLHVLFKGDLPGQILGEEYFLDLVWKRKAELSDAEEPPQDGTKAGPVAVA